MRILHRNVTTLQEIITLSKSNPTKLQTLTILYERGFMAREEYNRARSKALLTRRFKWDLS